MLADYFLSRLVQHLVASGSLKLVFYSGKSITVGDGTAPHVTVRLTDRRAAGDLVRDPELTLGELFTDGRLIVEEGTFYDLLQVTLQGQRLARSHLSGWLTMAARRVWRWLMDTNGLLGARRNVAHHYDLDGRLYDLFLDSDRQYSCAYFETPEASLDDAQLAKKRHITAKLLVEPGMSVLDIGCGWGGLGLYLAEIAGAGQVRGITLSEEQLGLARARAADAGLDQVSFVMEDYRNTEGQFDRLVSVGMFEHVGKAHFDEYFRHAAALMKPEGVMLMHSIGHAGVPDYTNPWITKYIFPGGYIPAMSEVSASVERAGLMITDVEVLRLHYAETLRNWRERFMARRADAAALYDERFCRMWEAYLAFSEAAFRYLGLSVFQFQIAKQVETVPLTRDYIGVREAQLRTREQARAARPAEVHLWAAQ